MCVSYVLGVLNLLMGFRNIDAYIVGGVILASLANAVETKNEEKKK
jgi:hypothetical protein